MFINTDYSNVLYTVFLQNLFNLENELCQGTSDNFLAAIIP